MTARSCLLQLATLGALTSDDLERSRTLANLDDQDRVLFSARNSAAAGDLNAAVALLRAQPSPAAAEILAELLAEAGRFGEAIAVCDDAWSRYGVLKALQDKINILVRSGAHEAPRRVQHSCWRPLSCPPSTGARSTAG